MKNVTWSLIMAIVCFLVATFVVANVNTQIEPEDQFLFYAITVAMYFATGLLILDWYLTKPLELWEVWWQTNESRSYEEMYFIRMYFNDKQDAICAMEMLKAISESLSQKHSILGIARQADGTYFMGMQMATKYNVMPDTDMFRWHDEEDYIEDDEMAAQLDEAAKIYDGRAGDIKEPTVIGKIDLDAISDTQGRDYKEGFYNVYHRNGANKHQFAGAVKAHSLEDAWSKAQNGLGDTVIEWSLNKARSTMIGDVIETPSSVLYKIVGKGFKELFKPL